MRRVDFLACLELHGADLQHVPRPLVEQLDDLFIQFVNRLAMFGMFMARNLERPCRIAR